MPFLPVVDYMYHKASQVAQWLGFHLPVWGVWAGSLVRDWDPTWLGAKRLKHKTEAVL